MNILDAFNKTDKLWDTTLNEWLDSDNKKVTVTNRGLLYSLDSECCDSCAVVVDQDYDLFNKPFGLTNGHKLCSSCLEEWIKLPQGKVDAFIIISQYPDKQYNKFVYNLDLQQSDIDEIIKVWNKEKQKLGLSPQQVQNIELKFIDSVTLLGLKVSTQNF
jgi:hypothetical protein